MKYSDLVLLGPTHIRKYLKSAPIIMQEIQNIFVQPIIGVHQMSIDLRVVEVWLPTSFVYIKGLIHH